MRPRGHKGPGPRAVPDPTCMHNPCPLALSSRTMCEPLDPAESLSPPWPSASSFPVAEGPDPGPHSHHRSLEELLASWDLRGSRDAEPPRAPRCRARRGPAGGSEAESSSSDSGAESPVCMEPPRPPAIRQHAAGSVSAQVWWEQPRAGERVSLYELQLRALGTGTLAGTHWFCLRGPECLQPLCPSTRYRLRLRGLNPAGPGAWGPPYTFCTAEAGTDPPPVLVTVRRRPDPPRRRTLYLPGP